MGTLRIFPKLDVPRLIERLDPAGIRFVYFSSEGKRRSRLFAEKLGLETDWNCSISLARASKGTEATDYLTDNSPAKLPIGIQSIRYHIEHIDNVPLLVSMFTDCVRQDVQEMISVLQENGEVVAVLGSAFDDNALIFAQGDYSIAYEPPRKGCLDKPPTESQIPISSTLFLEIGSTQALSCDMTAVST